MNKVDDIILNEPEILKVHGLIVQNELHELERKIESMIQEVEHKHGVSISIEKKDLDREGILYRKLPFFLKHSGSWEIQIERAGYHVNHLLFPPREPSSH